MPARKRIALAQNFIKKPSLVNDLLDTSSISTNDTVYEIGPGTGVITKELSKRAKKVIAIEKDDILYEMLKKKFEKSDNVVLHNADFMKFTIKDSYYKIYANIPFNKTSAILRKLLYMENPSDEAYLIMQKEAAEKFIGISKTSQFSVLAKPWFLFNISKFFKRTDFEPIPAVDIVMLHCKKRKPSLIVREETLVYERFIKLGFNGWKKNLKLNYKTVFSYTQWKRLSHDLHFPFHARPTDLSFHQWLGLFRFYMKLRDLLH
jgi:23S rRNA (adenine-N6)-dimethyltransferase